MQLLMILKTLYLLLLLFISQGLLHSLHPTSSTNWLSFSCSSQLYQKFDSILLLSHGRSLYFGPGSSSPAEYFANIASGIVPPCPQAYNVADYLLEVASEPPVALFQLQNSHSVNTNQENHAGSHDSGSEKAIKSEMTFPLLDGRTRSGKVATGTAPGSASRSQCATTFLTQLQCLCGREWKILRRSVLWRIIYIIITYSGWHVETSLSSSLMWL